MKSYIYNFFILVLCMIGVLSINSCKSDDEPLENDQLTSAEILYTFTISEDMLEYFNITANYISASGEKVGKHISGSTTRIATSATKFPSSLPISFTVTRTEKAAPSVVMNWSTSLEIEVLRHYSPSGTQSPAKHYTSSVHTPRPEKFNDWAKNFMSTMANPTEVTISSDGSVNF